MSSTRSSRPSPGRPEATTRGEIEQVAFSLFADRGFESTTLDMIAAELGVSRRTLFRYFSSKKDLPWGDFEASLEGFTEILARQPETLPLHEAVHRGVVAFNDFGEDSLPLHRQRMRLILTTPALQAHSVLRYEAWRQVIAEFVADRLALHSQDLTPQLIGHVSLALAITAYEQWLDDESADLLVLIDQAMASLMAYASAQW